MEQSGRNGWQMQRRRRRLRWAKNVAVGCGQLPFGAHGKEGVDGGDANDRRLLSIPQRSRTRISLTIAANSRPQPGIPAEG
jgi:hypothetical protein